MRLINADRLIENRFKNDISYNAFVRLIKRQPIIDAVPVKHAKLVNPNPIGECSLCGYLIDIRQEFNYCPNCGAKMDGGAADETD